MEYKHNDKGLSVREPEPQYAVKTVSIHEAKTNLSRLIKRAVEGETIYIGAYGKPDVALTAVNQKKISAALRAQAFGCMRGKITFREGWDDPLPDDIIDLMYSTDGWEDFIKK